MRRFVFYTFVLFTIALTINAEPASKVLILFDEEERHIDLVMTTRERIQRGGGRVRAVIGLAGILADVVPGSMNDITALKGVRVYDRDAAMAESADAETAAAVTAWNRLRTPIQAAPAASQRLLLDDVVEDSQRSRMRLQAETLAAGYREHVQELRRTLPWRLQRSSGIGCPSNGADYLDTSLYLAGDVAVGVFYYVPNVQNANPWTAALAAATFGDVVTALDAFIDIEPRARLTFTYVNEVDSGGNPLPKPSNEYLYVNDLRSTYCTDWAFLIAMSNGGVWPNANLHGPSLRMDRTFGAFHDVLRHEVAHMFGAYDAYPPIGPAGRFGYLLGGNTNACGQGGGQFAGTGECLADLMAGWHSIYGYNSRITPPTAAQLGWLAPRGDGILAVLDTKPVIDGPTVVHVVNAVSSVATYQGTAVDQPLLNEIPSGNSVSINRITAVRYRINNGAWQDATASDGVFDSASEDFHFATPPLRNGTYTVSIQAFNTIGAVTPAAHAEQLVIAGSGVANTRPFAALSVTPGRAGIGTTIKASGGGSTDHEGGALQYSWNWGSFWTPFSNPSLSTHVYTTPGTYTVQLRVRDQGGAIGLVSKQVTIAPADTPPVAKFAAYAENQHFTGANYTVFLSSVGSYDAETPFNQLKVQWDVDCDGWDAPPAFGKTKVLTLTNANYPRSDRRCVRMQVIDPANNGTQSTQFVWDVPYNQKPAISNVTFAPNGTDFIMTVSASDPDQATTWDGILEYRYDFEGDGIWDTTWSQSSASVLVKAADRYTVRMEVKDRFNARALWYWNPCAPLAC